MWLMFSHVVIESGVVIELFAYFHLFFFSCTFSYLRCCCLSPLCATTSDSTTTTQTPASRLRESSLTTSTDRMPMSASSTASSTLPTMLSTSLAWRWVSEASNTGKNHATQLTSLIVEWKGEGVGVEGGWVGGILSTPHQREEFIDVCRSFKSKCRRKKK